VNQLESFKDFVALNGFSITLGEIMRTEFGCEYRKLATLMRHEGWTVDVEIDRSKPGANVYRFYPPVKTETGMQRAFA
jgi:hypothetical protein